MDLKIIQSLLERVQIHKNAETKEFVGPEGFFWRTAGRLTIQDKQGTHLQLSLKKKKKKKTAVDHSGNNSIKDQAYVIMYVTIIFSCGLYVRVFYVKYLIQVSTK